MKRAILACLAAVALCSGCIFDDEFWEDGYDSTYDYPSGDDCDCEDEYFSLAPSGGNEPLAARPR